MKALLSILRHFFPALTHIVLNNPVVTFAMMNCKVLLFESVHLSFTVHIIKKLKEWLAWEWHQMIYKIIRLISLEMVISSLYKCMRWWNSRQEVSLETFFSLDILSSCWHYTILARKTWIQNEMLTPTVGSTGTQQGFSGETHLVVTQ